MSKLNQKIAAAKPDELFGRVASILDEARGNVARVVNTQMVTAYWLIGREIVEEWQGGEERAAYGKKVMEDLSARLTVRYGQGFSGRNLKSFRQFYICYSERLTIVHPVDAQSEIPSPMGTEFPLSAIGRPAGDELPQGF